MVCILLGTGFEEAEALVPADLLRRAGIPVALVGVDGRSVTGSHAITVAADCTLDEVDPEAVELVMLPGGLGGVAAMTASGQAVELIRQAHARGIPLAAICAAPTLLAKLGLLEGRNAVCYPGMESQLTGALPQPGARVVEDGPILTGQAAGSAFDFGLKLIEVLRGPQAAQTVRHAIHYHG